MARSMVGLLLSILAALALGAGAALVQAALRRRVALESELEGLRGTVRELGERLEAAEAEAARALSAAEVAASLLLEKGVADEEDLEAARARSGLAPADSVPGREGVH